MDSRVRYMGVDFNNLRKALYLLFFGTSNGECNDFNSPKYRYIIPMQGNFENPTDNPPELNNKDTYIMYWIEKDTSLTQDDYVEDYGEDEIPVNRQKCVSSILLRFVGVEAEQWAKSLRHLTKRSGVTKIWSGVCNAENLEWTSPIIPRKVSYSGLNSQVAFDIRFKLYYDEVISTGWLPLKGIDMHFLGKITVEE